jgi:PII-like signaling protein
MLARPSMTLERVRVCKRDGERLGEPRHLPETDASGLGVWQKLMVYAAESAGRDGSPVYRAIVHALREAGASGATSLRGVWGYHGDHEPHGDSFWQLQRRVPVLTVVVDTPARIRQWFAIIDGLTDETGLVTSETVPRVTHPRAASGT